MKPAFALLFILFMAAPIAADARIDKIYQQFQDGEISRAREEFRRLPQTTARDGNRLFITSLLESHGPSARSQMMAALKSDLDGKYLEQARFRLILLASAAGDTAAVLSQASEFLDRWESSRFREALLALMAAHTGRGGSERSRYLDLLIDEYPGSYYGQYARLARIRAAFDRRQFKTATTLCRQINNSPVDDLTPLSLIMLARIALERGDSEKALLNYNILNEQYRYVIGMNDLFAALKRESDEQSGREATEIHKGITFSVQVGVFSVKDNAKRLSKRIEAYGYETRLEKRNISGKDYYVVLAGKFETLQRAETARQKLEMGENEIFKVVVIDEN